MLCGAGKGKWMGAKKKRWVGCEGKKHARARAHTCSTQATLNRVIKGTHTILWTFHTIWILTITVKNNKFFILTQIVKESAQIFYFLINGNFLFIIGYIVQSKSLWFFWSPYTPIQCRTPKLKDHLKPSSLFWND